MSELEAAAKKYAEGKSSASIFQVAHENDFIKGAEWQAERMYSEEEASELVHNIVGEYGKHYGIMIGGAKLNELFEQFKKK